MAQQKLPPKGKVYYGPEPEAPPGGWPPYKGKPGPRQKKCLAEGGRWIGPTGRKWCQMTMAMPGPAPAPTPPLIVPGVEDDVVPVPWGGSYPPPIAPQPEPGLPPYPQPQPQPGPDGGDSMYYDNRQWEAYPGGQYPGDTQPPTASATATASEGPFNLGNLILLGGIGLLGYAVYKGVGKKRKGGRKTSRRRKPTRRRSSRRRRRARARNPRKSRHRIRGVSKLQGRYYRSLVKAYGVKKAAKIYRKKVSGWKRQLKSKR